MNKLYLPTTAMIILGLTATIALAQPPSKDVNVINNPEVTIANQHPIPVTVENSGGSAVDYVSVTNSELVSSPTSFVALEVFNVPAGKLLIAEYVSIYLDVAVNNRPLTGLRIAARLDGNGTNSFVRYELGYMDEFVRTSRGTPNFITAREVKHYFSEGPVNCVSDTHFGGSDLDFGLIRCELSGRLIDAP